MRRTIGPFVVLAILPCVVLPAQARDILQRLASQRAVARKTLPIVSTPCPDGLGALVGREKKAVLARLGKPDIDEPGYGREGQPVTVHQYFFAPPDASWLGVQVSSGGYTAVIPAEPFTVLQFHYDDHDRILYALCYDH